MSTMCINWEQSHIKESQKDLTKELYEEIQWSSIYATPMQTFETLKMISQTKEVSNNRNEWMKFHISFTLNNYKERGLRKECIYISWMMQGQVRGQYSVILKCWSLRKILQGRKWFTILWIGVVKKGLWWGVELLYQLARCVWWALKLLSLGPLELYALFQN